MQFKVPQFLEIEDKIFGPFTFREFVYLVGGGGMCFVVYKLLGLVWGAIPILAIAGFAGMLTFYRPNNKPFIDMLEAGFKYGFQSKLYIWKRRQIKVAKNKAPVVVEDKNIAMRENVKLSGNKLRDLAWSLDVLDLKKEGNN
ncbi:MAG: PrgI family protein [Patescibacteria group bacterium]|nr:PrgI family protein [Patescibacteria group bacterium]